MNFFDRLITTFIWQSVPGWPLVSWRGAGSPAAASRMIVLALARYQQAFRVRLGVDPPPIVKPLRITFSRSERVGGAKARVFLGSVNRMQVAALPENDDQWRRLVQLIGHERFHVDRDLLTGDPDYRHLSEGFADIEDMLTDDNHRGWRHRRLNLVT